MIDQMQLSKFSTWEEMLEGNNLLTEIKLDLVELKLESTMQPISDELKKKPS